MTFSWFRRGRLSKWVNASLFPRMWQSRWRLLASGWVAGKFKVCWPGAVSWAGDSFANDHAKQYQGCCIPMEWVEYQRGGLAPDDKAVEEPTNFFCPIRPCRIIWCLFATDTLPMVPVAVKKGRGWKHTSGAFFGMYNPSSTIISVPASIVWCIHSPQSGRTVSFHKLALPRQNKTYKRFIVFNIYICWYKSTSGVFADNIPTMFKDSAYVAGLDDIRFGGCGAGEYLLFSCRSESENSAISIHGMHQGLCLEIFSSSSCWHEMF